jgi:hypothetical protein
MVAIVCTFVFVLQSIGGLPLQRPRFPPWQQPRSKGCPSVPILVFTSCHSRNDETISDGWCRRSIQDRSRFSSERNFRFSCEEQSCLVSVVPYKTIRVDFFCTSVRFKEFLFNKKNLSLCMWVLSLSFTLPGLDVVYLRIARVIGTE